MDEWSGRPPGVVVELHLPNKWDAQSEWENATDTLFADMKRRR